ncbi:MAG: histidine kinase, partial [Parasporobacterium sp.]|nr:histidine kinase [Parasporobacterium sp.]
MKKFKLFQTSFSKLILAFLLLGALPLLAFTIVFIVRYNRSLEDVMISNYSQMNGYLAGSVDDILQSADASLEDIYEYKTPEGYTLPEALSASELDADDREININEALSHLLNKNEYISSVKMVDKSGHIYGVFRNSGRTLRLNASSYLKFNPQGENGMKVTEKMILPAVAEDTYCVSSKDYVFDIVRNVMDVSNVYTADTRALATIYLGINTDQIRSLAENADVEARTSIYLWNNNSGCFLYSSDPADYEGESFAYKGKLEGISGFGRLDKDWVVYNQLSEMGYYVISVLDDNEVTGAYFSNGVFIMVILIFVIFVLVLAYMLFSHWMSRPHMELKKAMEKLQQGDTNARVQVVHTGDEMEYLCESFNKMAEEFQHNVEEVLVNQVMAKSAELDALKMQIQPHYLYNTLDVIRMTALDNDDELTADLIEALAAQLRYVMGSHDERVTIRQELDMLANYFVITRVRYENRFDLVVDINDEDQDLYILKMILQPIVENAIKHGLREKEGTGSVS